MPKSVGAGVGTLTVTDEYRSQTVTLGGVGVAPAGVSLSPVATIAFAATGVGLSAAAQTVTLTNNGGVPLLIQSMTATGDFAIAAGSNCGASLAVGMACTAQIRFTPTAAATRTGSFTVMDNAGSSPQSLQLTGMGVDFALGANGSTTQTITAGNQAAYGLLLTFGGGCAGDGCVLVCGSAGECDLHGESGDAKPGRNDGDHGDGGDECCVAAAAG